jgi:hypothetical protein
MPRYLVERLFDEISEDDMLAAAIRSDTVRQEDFSDMKWEHSYVCEEPDGKITTFCVYEAESVDDIKRHAEAFGSHVVGRVWEIVDDMSPGLLQQKLGARAG